MTYQIRCGLRGNLCWQDVLLCLHDSWSSMIDFCIITDVTTVYVGYLVAKVHGYYLEKV